MTDILRNHTTHFDDCGCKSAEYEKQIAELKAENGRERRRMENAVNGLLNDSTLAYEVTAEKYYEGQICAYQNVLRLLSLAKEQK